MYNLIEPGLGVEIHCVAYRMDSQRGNSNLPRYWITLDKETLWDYPKDFLDYPVFPTEMKGYRSLVRWCYPYGGNVPDISALLREYINTPQTGLLERYFERDHWGLTDILNASDRRFGRKRLMLLKESTRSRAVQAILDKRLSYF